MVRWSVVAVCYMEANHGLNRDDGELTSFPSCRDDDG